MTQPLSNTFDFLCEIMPKDPSWRVIGSAALWLSGVPVVPYPKDVDVVASSEVIWAVQKRLEVVQIASKPDEQFRSCPFFQYKPAGGVVIDFMGNLEIFTTEWGGLHFESCVSVGGVFVPDLTEQLAILHRFGRPKDLLRVDIIRQHIGLK